MACITLVAPLAMATTELARAARCEVAGIRQFEIKVAHTTLSASWVVVTDSAGNRQLQMQWMPSADLDWPLTVMLL